MVLLACETYLFYVLGIHLIATEICMYVIVLGLLHVLETHFFVDFDQSWRVVVNPFYSTSGVPGDEIDE